MALNLAISLLEEVSGRIMYLCDYTRRAGRSSIENWPKCAHSTAAGRISGAAIAGLSLVPSEFCGSGQFVEAGVLCYISVYRRFFFILN